MRLDYTHKIYIENSEQTQSTYSDDIEYKFEENKLTFKFNKSIAQKININNTVVIHLNINQQQMMTLEESLNAIFEHKTVTTI